MKVVLFCGGLGTRLRDMPEPVPKPMAPIGIRPIIWHLMKYYAHFGHREIILCLGYRADAIKNYFLSYNECSSNDFVLSDGGKTVELMSRDIHDWRITFVDTGLRSNLGQRLMRVRHLLGTDEMFLANYADGLTDLPLNVMVDKFQRSNAVAAFLAVKPTASFHVARLDEQGSVLSFEHISRDGGRHNGGFFALRREIFDYMENGDELVERPFQRLIDAKKLMAYPYDGFWACMDTFKEKQQLDDLYEKGEPPWEVWLHRTPAGSQPSHATT